MAMVTGEKGSQETYEGKFYQITSDSRIDTLGPLWHPWHPGWYGWPYWDPEPQEAFITNYSGHVVANLAGPDGKRMRCDFQLLRAAEGMKGGGQGRCQLPSEKIIKADFPPSLKGINECCDRVIISARLLGAGWSPSDITYKAEEL